jgi:molecular chaperone GrpE (heat shock protein)
MPEDAAVTHDVERLRERAKQARDMAHKRKDSGTKQLLIALAENFERLAELATNERHAAPSQTAATSP